MLKNTNSKHQIPNKSQIPIFNDQNLPGHGVVLNFGHWDFFDIWDLIFGISISRCNSNKANPLSGKIKAGSFRLGFFI